jgi:predicted ATPase
MSKLPSGTVTFLFTDIEGSTKLLHEVGSAAYDDTLAEHHRVFREAFARHGGVEVDTEGDAFFVAFPEANGAVAAAAEANAALASGPIRVRMGLHTGSPHVGREGYIGPDVHKGARIAAAAHGGQIVLSRETRALLDEGFELLDLGEHRVKDFDAPVWIYQLSNERFPPLKTISNTNLPRPASTFVGREREVAELGALLRDGARLVTLTGPGGTGKTRLAIEAAAELVPAFRNGVFWIGLADLRDPTLVTDTIARTIGAKDGLSDHIGEREMLLLADNLEQVVSAAPELASLVEACPNLRLLATSRERLRVRGETEYAVSPLADAEAVDLFTTRSKLAPDDTIARLCRRLDNLPLAVELAAARTSVLSPRQILDRLSGRLDLLKGGRDAEARQATLRAAIEWSYDLLNGDEQQLFARLGVFRGGWTLDAAEAVADADLDTLQSLVDKSLVRRTGERFAMLETIREFAAERLEQSSDIEDVRRRHAERFLVLAEDAYEGQHSSENAWFPILEAEHDNIRAVLDWARERRPVAQAQLAGAVAPYWMRRGHATESIERLRGALSRYEVPDAIRARALTHLGELEDAVPTLEEALRLWRELGDARGEGLALEAIGWAHDTYGDYTAARAAYDASLAVRQRAGIPEIEAAGARAGLCHALVASAKTRRAEAMATELLAVALKSDASLMQQLALHFLADCPLVDGDYPEAERRYLRALAYARNAELVGRCIDEVLGVAMALAGQGDFARAIRLAAAAHAKHEELGRSTDRWWGTMQERLLGRARTELTPADLAEAEREGRARSFEGVLDELLGPEDG